MRRILKTISADININAEIDIMNVDSEIELKAILEEEVDYEDWDALLDKADRALRLVAKYIYENEGLVTSVEITEPEETNNVVPKNYEVIIDLEPYMVKYIIDILEIYKNMQIECIYGREIKKVYTSEPTTQGGWIGGVVVFDNNNWMSEDEEEYASILPNIIVYVPIYNTHRNVIKNIVCINSF